MFCAYWYRIWYVASISMGWNICFCCNVYISSNKNSRIIEGQQEEKVVNPRSPASMLPYTGYIPYEPKPSMSQAERDKLFRERNLATFKRPDPLDVPNDDEI